MASAISVGVDVVGSALPTYNTGSKRFHNIVGSGKGQFVKNSIGRAALAVSGLASKVASAIGGLFANEDETGDGNE